jgi:hypothetical protein
MKLCVIAMDIAKKVFQLHWVDAESGSVERLKLKRAQVLLLFANRPSALVVMEACGSAHESTHCADPLRAPMLEGGAHTICRTRRASPAAEARPRRSPAAAQDGSPVRPPEQDRCRGRAGDLDGKPPDKAGLASLGFGIGAALQSDAVRAHNCQLGRPTGRRP